jgi:hypothetical protein
MNRHRLARSAALGLALAALAASTASANTVDLRSQMGTSSLAGTTSSAPRQDLRSADARDAALSAKARQGQPRQDMRSPDTRDYAVGRGTFSAPEVTVVKVTEPAPPSAGLDWGDAGIGAGGMLGLILLALGSILAVIHRQAERCGRSAGHHRLTPGGARQDARLRRRPAIALRQPEFNDSKIETSDGPLRRREIPISSGDRRK